jgi:VCBS repeat-containing protein
LQAGGKGGDGKVVLTPVVSSPVLSNTTVYVRLAATNGLGTNTVDGVFAYGTAVYAATRGGGLSISTDGGSTFTIRYATANGLGSDSVRAVFLDEFTKDIYVATSGGMSILRQDESGPGTVTGFAQFTDTASRTLSYSTRATSTGGGSVSVNAGTGAFTYIPTQAQRQAATATTTDTFTITASNGVNTATQVVTVPVAPLS